MNNQILVDLVLEIKKDLGDIQKDVTDIKIETVKNTASLDQHMLRSDLSEARLEVQEEKLENFIVSMEPVKDHVKTVNTLTKIAVGILKIVGLVASAIGAVMAILRLK